jgi:hypothetical protein
MRNALLVALFLVAVGAALPAQEGTVSFGVGAGVAVPHGEEDITEANADTVQPSFSWGYYVNIPLISTFYITPSSTLYRIEERNATDIDLAFKFMVPLDQFQIYAGFKPGLTTVPQETAPHVGILGGTSFELVSNLDVFLDGTYSFLFLGNDRPRVFNIAAGLLFSFE